MNKDSMELLKNLLIIIQLVNLTIISIIDIKEKKIYNKNCLIVLVVSMTYMLLDDVDWSNIILAVLSIGLLMLCIAIVTNGCIGGGDIKLMMACSIMLGFEKIICAFISGMVIAGIVGGIMIVFRYKRKNDCIALGPALSVGVMIAFVWGDKLIKLMQ